MDSSDGFDLGRCDDLEVLLIDSDQFEIVFQILNEAPNLPDRILSRLDKEGIGDVDSVVQAARSISGKLEGIAVVKFVINNPSLAKEVDGRRLFSIVDNSVNPGQIEVLVNRDLLDAWKVLTEVVLEFFSELELRFRTGYYREDLEQARGYLSG
jgi:hypothetical protein